MKVKDVFLIKAKRPPLPEGAREILISRWSGLGIKAKHIVLAMLHPDLRNMF